MDNTQYFFLLVMLAVVAVTIAFCADELRLIRIALSELV